MDTQNNSRSTETAIGGTVYVVESCVCETAKESTYAKLKRLITTNAKHLEKLSDSSNISTEINSTTSKQYGNITVPNRLKTVGKRGQYEQTVIIQ